MIILSPPLLLPLLQPVSFFATLSKKAAYAFHPGSYTPAASQPPCNSQY
jgi:hypothetical protein